MKTLRSPNTALLFAIIAMLLLVKSASAQDAVAVDPRHFRVEFESNQIRVLRITLGPGETSPIHSHPSGQLVLLSDYHFRLTLPDGQTQERRGKAGDVIMWPTPVQYLSENLSDKALEAILVEIKPQPVVAMAMPLARASRFAFKPLCDNPSFPTPPPSTNLGIDLQCSINGSGGTEAQQNDAKNNFCASGES